jgi:hypothetical protein
MRRFFLLLILCVFVPLWLGNLAGACSIPVFRYAMERWPAYYYEAIVIHKGPLADDDPAANPLKAKQAEFLNLRVSPIDISSPEAGGLTGLLGGPVPETLPALVLWYPNSKGRAAPFWTGPFTVGTVESIIQSPKRRELARRLTAGQTAVWVFVESGRAGKDKAAMQLIQQELEKASKELKEMAPTFAEEYQAAEPDQSGTEGFSYEFSILPVSRSDPKEQILLETLLNSEPDLDEYSDEPIVFPTFGRGRALFALVGEGINTDNLREAIAFITGPCGCEIKMLNPGVDLLMNENWDAAAMQFYQEFYEMAEEPLPELTGVFPEEPNNTGLNAQGEVVAAAISESPQPLSTPAGRTSVPQRKIHGLGVIGTTAVSLAAILIAVGLGTLAVTKRKKSG